MSLSRRDFALGSAAILGASFVPVAHAQNAPLQVFAHRVHKTVAVGASGDATAYFTKATGMAVEWTTFDTNPLQDRVFREASLGDSAVDVAFIVNTQAAPRIATLFDALDLYMAKDPIDDKAD